MSKRRKAWVGRRVPNDDDASLMNSFSELDIDRDTFKSEGPPVLNMAAKSARKDKTMKSIIRKDEAAVSPVIATILMVAITVVLAAVLYVMVSGLLTPTGTGPKTIGVVPGRSTDGTNWTLTFANVPTGLTTAGTKLTIISGSGSTTLGSKAFSALTWATDKVVYIQASAGSAVGVGDRLLISTTTYGPSGYSYQLSDGTSILAQGSLQG